MAEPITALDPEARELARLREARGFVVDMDGTLVVGDPFNGHIKALPGAVDFVAHLRARGIPLVVFTNGTNRSPVRYAAHLRAAGIPVSPTEILTPLHSAVTICRRRGHHRVMLMAAGGGAVTLRKAGIDVVPALGRRDDVDAVIVGWFPQLRYAHLEAACHAVWSGARLYSASQSRFFATSGGKTLATSRAISAAIHSITDRRVELVGKPSALAMAAAAEHLGIVAENLAVVGDDPELEVPMARRSGALGVAVYTGIAGRADFAAQPAELRPDLSFPSLAELLAALAA